MDVQTTRKHNTSGTKNVHFLLVSVFVQDTLSVRFSVTSPHCTPSWTVFPKHFTEKKVSVYSSQELPKFRELIFEDFSRFILVENIFEEVVLQSVTKDIMMGKTLSVLSFLIARFLSSNIELIVVAQNKAIMILSALYSFHCSDHLL